MSKTNKLKTSKEAEALGLKRISRNERPLAVRHLAKPIEKQRISINLDKDIIAHFKQASGGRGYQTMINNALRDLIFAGQETFAESLLNNPVFIKELKEKLGV